jgi:hypothetical protein
MIKNITLGILAVVAIISISTNIDYSSMLSDIEAENLLLKETVILNDDIFSKMVDQ